MPYTKPGVETQRNGTPGTPLGNTNYFVSTVVGKTLGAATSLSRTATVSGDTESIYVNGQMVQPGDLLSFERVNYNSTTMLTNSLGHNPVLNILSVSTDQTNPYARTFTNGVDFIPNLATGALNFSIAPQIPTPEFGPGAIFSTAGGGAVTNQSYDFAIVALDANNNTTLAATTTYVVPVASSSVTVNWGKVVTAAGYKVYARVTGGANSVWALQPGGTISNGYTTTFVITTAIANGALTLPVTNTTKHTPANAALGVAPFVYVSYQYQVYNYNSPKRYFDTNTVQNDHGVGSELSNAARLIIGPAGTGAGAGSVYLVAPNVSNGDILGFQNAIDSCTSIQALTIMSTTSSSDSVNQYLNAHCISMSLPENAKERFAVVSTTAAIMANSDVTQTTNKILAFNNSNRVMFIVTDGGAPMLNTWQNTPIGYTSINGTTDPNGAAYEQNIAVDGQWHAIATNGMITALPDPATPATNKQVYGISTGIPGTVALWTDSRKNAIAAAGGCVLEDRFGNVFVRHGLTVSQNSVEDSEMSIVLAEAYMAKRLRDTHAQYIGQKLTNSLLENVTATTNTTLSGLIGDVIIRSFQAPTITQDTNNPTKVNVVFSYKPIYPTNNILFTWGFDTATA